MVFGNLKVAQYDFALRLSALVQTHKRFIQRLAIIDSRYK